MIKPDTLWNLFKNCKRPETLGRVCFALANREDELETPLNEYEETLANLVRESDEWMTEAIDAVKRRKHEYYARKRKITSGLEKLDKLDSKNSTDELDSNLSIDELGDPPSVRPSIHNNIISSGGGSNARATPSQKIVIKTASKPIPTYPSTFTEIEDYFESQGIMMYDPDAIKAKFVDIVKQGWKDGNGKKIKDWQAFMRLVCERINGKCV